ncbi:MAG TPA: T9SS type A sorting domain-containing protein [Chitinophagales bacterium]|nr:T9SS type A sorting domain-containing protein [Chitinophagales bacterium]
MKSFYLTLLLLFAGLANTSAQITITETDFADAGDTVRMSVATWNPLLNFSATGANHTWNFSNLDWQSQYVDEYQSTLNTGTTYAITFSDLSFNPYRCNIAKDAENPLTTLPIVSSVFTEGVNFYYKNSSMYRQRGIGMRVSGFRTPIPMTHPDTLYHFPISYGNRDSSWSDYTVFVPNLGVYSHKQRRWNEVDGWGTLTTPFGTFDAVRVRTEIRGVDSIYVDTLGQGFKVESDIIREYKWFGKNQNNPLLQINTQAGLFGQFQGFEFVTRVIYRDSVRFEPTGIWDAQASDINLQVYPNPASDVFFVSVPSNEYNNTFIRITDISGKLMEERHVNMPVEPVSTIGWAKGIYLLAVETNAGRATRKVVVQ